MTMPGRGSAPREDQRVPLVPVLGNGAGSSPPPLASAAATPMRIAPGMISAAAPPGTLAGRAGGSAGFTFIESVAPVAGAGKSPDGLSIVAGTAAADVDMAATNATIRIIRDIALPFS